jgi:hypothetical protein
VAASGAIWYGVGARWRMVAMDVSLTPELEKRIAEKV